MDVTPNECSKAWTFFNKRKGLNSLCPDISIWPVVAELVSFGCLLKILNFKVIWVWHTWRKFAYCVHTPYRVTLKTSLSSMWAVCVCVSVFLSPLLWSIGYRADLKVSLSRLLPLTSSCQACHWGDVKPSAPLLALNLDPQVSVALSSPKLRSPPGPDQASPVSSSSPANAPGSLDQTWVLP